MDQVVQCHVEGKVTEEEIVIGLGLVAVGSGLVRLEELLYRLRRVQEIVVGDFGKEEVVGDVAWKGEYKKSQWNRRRK